MNEKKKLWCSAHKPLPEQGNDFILLAEQGEEGKSLQERLNNCPNDKYKLEQLAKELIGFAVELGADIYQPGGSPAFQFVLGLLVSDEIWSARQGFKSMYIPSIYYAHSERVSQDVLQPDGSVKKVSVFKHKDWIQVI